jgi:LacI family transcriptional regulator
MRAGTAKKPRFLNVALAVPQGFPFLERSLHGIAAYARQAGSWTFTRRPDAMNASIEWLKGWPGDGAFAFIVARADERIAQRLPFPVVNLASHLSDMSVPSVVVDHAKLGEMGARHLIDRQFKRFGFFGAAGLWYSQMRSQSFCRTVEQAGGACEIFESMPAAAGTRWRNEQKRLDAWLASLRPPVGIMASNDLRAGIVLDACRRLHLHVPDDVAVIGVDNDPVFAEFDDPPLTSISRNDYEVGRQAAALLERLIRKEKPANRLIFIPPEKVVPRRSTDTMAVEDEVVAGVVRYINEHLHESFGVQELLSEHSLSRRSLEYHFQSALRCSPYEYISQARVARAKLLLQSQPGMKLAAISSACGFSTSRRFRLVFRRLVGMTPARYRRTHAPGAASAQSVSARR